MDLALAKGVRFPPAPQRKASQAKVAQELPSNPSGAVTREQPGEKAATGRREYVETTNDTTLLKQAERRFDSAPRARVYDRLFNF